MGAETLTGTETLSFARPESWAMKYFTSATLLTGFGPPRTLELGAVRLGLEVDYVPYVSDRQRVVGFNGSKAEDLNQLPVFARPLFTVGLPWHVSVGVSYVPPIQINGVKPDLFSLFVGRPFLVARNLTVGVSAYGQAGSVTSAFTCPQSAVQAGSDLEKNPFGCIATSQDRVYMNYAGLQVSSSYRMEAAHRLEPYASVAANYMNLGFRVDARYGEVIDHTRLQTQGGTFSTTAGLLFPVTDRFDVAGEVFYSPLTVQRPFESKATEGLLNFRALIAYRLF